MFCLGAAMAVDHCDGPIVEDAIIAVATSKSAEIIGFF